MPVTEFRGIYTPCQQTVSFHHSAACGVVPVQEMLDVCAAPRDVVHDEVESLRESRFKISRTTLPDGDIAYKVPCFDAQLKNQQDACMSRMYSTKNPTIAKKYYSRSRFFAAVKKHADILSRQSYRLATDFDPEDAEVEDAPEDAEVEDAPVFVVAEEHDNSAPPHPLSYGCTQFTVRYRRTTMTGTMRVNAYGGFKTACIEFSGGLLKPSEFERQGYAAYGGVSPAGKWREHLWVYETHDTRPRWCRVTTSSVFAGLDNAVKNNGDRPVDRVPGPR